MGEHLRAVRNINGPHQRVRQLFQLMHATTADEWATVARRMAKVPQSFDGWHAALTEGDRLGLHAAPLQLATAVAQLDEWLDTRWWHGFVDDAADGAALRADLHRAADAAVEATAALRTRLVDQHLPAAVGTPDAVGEERYKLGARLATGADLDLQEAYAWAGRSSAGSTHRSEPRRTTCCPELHRSRRWRTSTPTVRPSTASTRCALCWLQELLDRAVDELTGHFTIEGPCAASRR